MGYLERGNGWMPRWSKWYRESKTDENENKYVIHRDITENETETNRDSKKNGNRRMLRLSRWWQEIKNSR